MNFWYEAPFIKYAENYFRQFQFALSLRVYWVYWTGKAAPPCFSYEYHTSTRRSALGMSAYFPKRHSCASFRRACMTALSCRERGGDSRQFRRYLRGDAWITATLISLSGFSDRCLTEWKGNEARPLMTLRDSMASIRRVVHDDSRCVLNLLL